MRPCRGGVWGYSGSHLTKEVRLGVGVGCFVLIPDCPPPLCCSTCCVTLGKPLSLSEPIRIKYSLTPSLDFLETPAASRLCAEKNCLFIGSRVVLTLQKLLMGVGVMARL